MISAGAGAGAGGGWRARNRPTGGLDRPNAEATEQDTATYKRARTGSLGVSSAKWVTTELDASKATNPTEAKAVDSKNL